MESCGICLDNLENDVFELNCNHVFHKDCIKKWCTTCQSYNSYNNKVPATCPYCRANIEQKYLNILNINVNTNSDQNNFQNQQYFNYIEPYDHHSQISLSLDNTHIYSFALYPETYQPSGSINFSRISET